MKLNKLYCNDSDFKTVIFKDKLNVIVGYGSKLTENDSHNLGKTTVINLIDYMLLKDISSDKVHILKKKKDFFKNYIFFLEIEYNQGLYLTIKREVINSKISIKKHNVKYQNFIDEKEWDYDKISLKKAKEILNSLLSYDVKSNYRKFLKFILRTQKDYDFKFKKNEVKDIDWKPYIMEMLGYKYDEFYKLFDLRTQKEELSKQLSEYKDNYFEELDEKRNIKEIYESKITELEKLVEDYDYYKIDDSVNSELINEINNEISLLNKRKYNLSFDISNIKKNLSYTLNTLDISELEDIYREAKIYFGDSLKKDYKSLIKFNEQISKEREKNLKKLLESKERELKEINILLVEKNQVQKKCFEILETNKAVKKIILHNNELNSYKLKYAKLSSELDAMEKNIKNNQTLKTKTNELNELLSKISVEIAKNENLLRRRISEDFSNYTKEILFDSEAKLSVFCNRDGYPEMDMKVYSIAKGEVTAEDNGNNYNKHIKCCFDLSIITAYKTNNKNYFKFVFHDGSIEASDNKLKISFINLVEKLCDLYNIQYITTTIYDEISQENIFNKIGEENIILKLNDSEDYSGTLFGKRF